MQRFKVGELVVDPGTPILLQGSNSPQLYTVLHGYGVRSRLLENGRRQVINFVLPGDFPGLQAGLMGEMGHSVEVTTKLTLCVFDRAAACGLTNDASLPFPFRQQDLADALGLSLVHTNKLITAFRNEQLISWADNVVQIYDLEALAEIGLTDTEAAKVRPIM